MKNVKKNKAKDYPFMFYVICVIIIIMITVFIDKQYKILTPLVQRNLNYNQQIQRPFLISPSNVVIVSDRSPENNVININQTYTLPFIGNKVEKLNSKKVIVEDTKREEYVFDRQRKEFRSLPEMLCCKVLEEIVEERVQVNTRPDILKNTKTGENLELDLYYENNRGKKLAIEYNGSYHYKLVPFFHKKGLESLKGVQERDKLKEKLCKQNGIHLITVPYTVDAAISTTDKEGNKI